MELSDAAEEILERLWIDIVEEKEDFVELTNIDSEKAVKELLESKYITISNDMVKLTEPKGYRAARQIIIRHRLAERLLHDILEVERDDLETEACKFEHIITEGIEERICTLLGHPKMCPHGKPIPSSRCCKEGKETADKVVSSLSRLRGGQHGRIVYILTKDRKILQKLLALGVLPGKPVEIIQTYPSYVFQIGQTQVAVDTQIANDIFVRVV